MQVLLKKNMTIFYIDYCYMKFIYYFIENNFKNKLLRKDSITLFNLQIESKFHKEVLIKWLYNLYKRKENSKKHLLESKLLIKSKTVKIIFAKPTCISIIWKIIDEKYISFNFLKDDDTKDEFYKEAYSILNLKDFTDDIRLIKKQYRLLATTYHPDFQNTSCPQTQLVYTKKFQEINSAYQAIISQIQ